MRKRIITILLILMIALLLCLTACTKAPSGGESSESAISYTQIDQETAKEMMEKDDGHIVVDVRRQDEYDAGHIPDAILIPNETISTMQPKQLPDLDQVILIYCRSGNRSKQAAQKLAEIGYKNIYEFGGIIDWTGETVVTEETPESEVVTTEATSEIENETTEEDTGMKLFIGEAEVPVTWEDNESVEELKSLLPLTIQMSMYEDFEQVGSIGQSIARNDEQTTTESGDIVLYSGEQIVIFYGSNSWAYTRLGHIELEQSEMAELLGQGDVRVSITD